MSCLGLSLIVGGAICLTRSVATRTDSANGSNADLSLGAVSNSRAHSDDSRGALSRVSDDLSQYPTGPLAAHTRRKYRRIAGTLVVTGAALVATSLLNESGPLAVGLGLGGVFLLALGSVFRIAIWRNIHIWRE